MLEEIVDRRLVLAYARRTNRGATPAELEAARKEFLAKLQAQRRTPANPQAMLAEYLKGQGIERADLERQLVWNVIWEKYLARYVTADRVAAYFQAHRRELDGTEALAGQILLKPAAGPGGPEAMDQLLDKARRIREEIVAGKISFADAAKQYSSAPSARQGGELGWIGRHDAMGETFCRAVFALEPGQVSEPVKTPSGVSLIRVERYKPGPKQLADVRKTIQEALARELMEKLADAERPTSPVVFTGKLPYFKAGTHELAPPVPPGDR
jgi:parvulin-like peptidyl-prolyl isomerase